ncbi:MAG: hypothetical protein L0216_09915 [Planctomycetales bacterium]|nr:hypothetical protein [Planctomycetales bacterium]
MALKRFSRLAVLVAVVLVALLNGPAWAHEERDLVCGMAVDVDTAKFIHEHAGRKYYF